MDYISNIKQTYQVPNHGNNTALVYFTNGDIQTVELSQPAIDYDTVEELEYYVSNYVNREYSNYSTNMLVGFSVTNGTDLYYVSSNKVDYLIFGSSTSPFTVSAVVDVNLNSSIDDYSGINNYSTVTSYGTFTVQNLDYFNFTINNNSVVFDYTNLYFDNSSYKQEVRNIRGENISYYITYHYVEDFVNDNLYISYGSPISDIANSEYTRGFNAGYGDGYVTGNDNGYQIGINQNGNIGQENANAFNYIGQAFGAVGSIMSLEILPNITLGLAFSIPMVFVLIMTIFKLVRK